VAGLLAVVAQLRLWTVSKGVSRYFAVLANETICYDLAVLLGELAETESVNVLS
jgi:hypothetical protein